MQLARNMLILVILTLYQKVHFAIYYRYSFNFILFEHNNQSIVLFIKVASWQVTKYS